MWVLIIFAHVGMMGKGDSNALTTVSGFTSNRTCMEAGAISKTLTQGTVKEINYKCVEVK